MGVEIPPRTLSQIVEILKRGSDMTIATIRPDGFPQATTVSYVSEGMAIYFGCAAKSQKAQNITRCNKISLTVNLPYGNWDEIGIAERMTNNDKILRAGKLMFEKFPQVAKYTPPNGVQLVLFKVAPFVVSLLDYSRGFGHTELVSCKALAPGCSVGPRR